MADALVLQSDFGVADGAVSAMYGVALSVSPTLRICDLTHEIPQYDIWEASYRLIQTVSYWPEGTVFVSVVDPGVGSARRSIVAKTANGRYVVTPDNGTLTHVKRMIGLSEVRVIDEGVNRLAGSSESYTFFGRDVYVYTGARLAAGVIDVAGVGPEVAPESVIELPIVDRLPHGASPTCTWASRWCIRTASTAWPSPSTRAASPRPTASARASTGRSRCAKHPASSTNNLSKGQVI